MSEELLDVSLEEAQQADALDYHATPEQAAAFRLDRPWDRHLQPLLATLRARCSTQDGAAAEERAALYTQRARECKGATMRNAQLHQAMQALRELPLVQPVAPAEPEGDAFAGLDARERYLAARKVTVLWAAAVKAAWSLHLYTVVLEAAPYVAWFDWEPATDREMALLQVRCSESCPALRCAAVPQRCSLVCDLRFAAHRCVGFALPPMHRHLDQQPPACDRRGIPSFRVLVRGACPSSSVQHCVLCQSRCATATQSVGAAAQYKMPQARCQGRAQQGSGVHAVRVQLL